jgi:hypothetical protein
MDGREKPHTEKYKEIASDWNYDAICVLTSFPVLDFFLHRVYTTLFKDSNKAVALINRCDQINKSY